MKTRLAILGVALALVLTGCANGAGASGSGEGGQSAQQQAAEATPTPTEAAGPLTATTPEALPAEDADASFLRYVADELPPATSIADASDAQLIAAGHDACEQVSAGVPWENIRLVEGEEPSAQGYYLDSSAILNGALYFYCPDLIPKVD